MHKIFLLLEYMRFLMLDYRTDTFLTVCKTMNFTLAAKELHITQPAVSQHIHYLKNSMTPRCSNIVINSSFSPDPVRFSENIL